MEFSVKSGSPEKQRSACIVVGVFEPRRLSPIAEQLDKISDGYISALLRRGGMVKQASDVLSVGDIVLSPSHREVTVAGEPLKLTLREFDLLEYLMRKPGVVFTRESLLQSVWGWDFDGGSRTVDVHVQTLRQKLGEHASAIETVRGVGYRLAEPSAGDGAEGDDTAATASEE